jgi:1,4-alpha-glucan branching enzyme
MSQAVAEEAQDKGESNKPAEGSRAFFMIHAPGKKKVTVAGEFNDWTAEEMEEKDGHWTLERAIPPGRYRYAFKVDGQDIADPQAREIEWDDDGPHSILNVGAPEFEWKHDQFDRADYQDLVIYELLVNDFTPEGTFEGVIGKLDYLQDLGINALQLMPIAGTRPDDTWGYANTFLHAVRPTYGKPDDLKRLIDEAHARNIAVIFDLCIAHTGHDHPFTALYKYEKSPWYGEAFGGTNEFGFPTLDPRKPAAHEYVCDVVQFWIRDFHIDGYRIDYAKLIGENDEGLGMPNMFRWIREMRADAYIICEVLPEQPENISTWDTNGVWHESMQDALKFILEMDLKSEEEQLPEERWSHLCRALNPTEEGYQKTDQCVNYSENHDELRMMKLLMDQNLHEDHAAKRCVAVFALVATAPGPPLMYHGQEWGEQTDKSQGPNPIYWDRLENDIGRGMHEQFRRLAWLRRNTPALRTSNVEVRATDPMIRCLELHRWDEGGSEVVTAVNFSTATQDFVLKLSPGPWKDALTDGEINSETGEFQVRLEPFDVQVWVKQ